MNCEEMKADRDVLGHIRRINLKEKKRMEKEGGVACFYREEAASNYETVYDFEKSMAIIAYQVAHKAKFGSVPTTTVEDGTSFDEMSLTQIRESAKRL